MSRSIWEPSARPLPDKEEERKNDERQAAFCDAEDRLRTALLFLDCSEESSRGTGWLLRLAAQKLQDQTGSFVCAAAEAELHAGRAALISPMQEVKEAHWIVQDVVTCRCRACLQDPSDENEFKAVLALAYPRQLSEKEIAKYVDDFRIWTRRRPWP